MTLDLPRITRPIRALLGDKSVPSILDQTTWDCGFYKFPTRIGDEFFNCSIFEWNGLDWLAVRHRNGPPGTHGINTIEIWNLKDGQPNRMFPVSLEPRFVGEHFEDPRVFVMTPKSIGSSRVVLSYCNFSLVSYAHQCVTGLFENFAPQYPVHVEYGRNGGHLYANTGHEKNWCWFDHNGSFRFVYEISPFHTVCGMSMGRVTEIWKHQTDVTWNNGLPRGGTSPVHVGHEYFSFFHSSEPWTTTKRRYHMGAYAFTDQPPFGITRMTPKPLLSGSERDFRRDNHPLVVFPCGSIYRNEEWTVSFGVNDNACAWIKIPHADLLKRMRPC